MEGRGGAPSSSRGRAPGPGDWEMLPRESTHACRRRSHLLPERIDERLHPLSVRRKAVTKTPAGREGKGMELF